MVCFWTCLLYCLNFGQYIFLIIQSSNFQFWKSKLRGRKSEVLLGNIWFYVWNIFLKVWFFCVLLLLSDIVFYNLTMWIIILLGIPCWFFPQRFSQNLEKTRCLISMSSIICLLCSLSDLAALIGVTGGRGLFLLLILHRSTMMMVCGWGWTMRR